MEKEKVARINELARKSKETELTEDEKKEQATLRQEYINEIKGVRLAKRFQQFMIIMRFREALVNFATKFI